MSESQFIGRGELLVKKILFRLVECIGVQGQVPLNSIVLPEDYAILDQEVKNHKFDLVIRRTHEKDVVVEVNYKHKEKAARKWRQIFTPLIENAEYDYVTIDEWDCRSSLEKTLGLFHLNSKKEHTRSWNDERDVIDALEKAGVQP